MFLEEYSWFHDDPPGRKWNRGASRNTWEEEAVQEVRQVAYGVVAPVIVSVGLLGNVLVIVLLRLPQFKGVVFSFFTALAVADLLSLGFCISPLHHAITGTTLHRSTAVWYSYFELLFVGAAMSTSVLIVVCITVYRFFSVCRPAKFQRLNTPRFAWMSMAAALGTAVVAWLPMSFVQAPRTVDECQSSSFTPPDNRTWWVSCLIHDTGDKGYFIAYSWIRQTVVTFLPIVAVVTLNLFTLRGFFQHRRMRHRMLNQQTSGQSSVVSKSSEEKYLMGLLIAVMVSFVITIVPSGVANAINTSTTTSELEFVIFSAVANNLEILNHTLNFYLYILCSKPVRDTLMGYYRKHRTNMTWRFDGFSSSREGRAGTDGGRNEERRNKSDSPFSKSKTEEDSQQIYVIACTALPSESPPAIAEGTDRSVWLEENRHNEELQHNTKPATTALPGGHDNPNFDFN